MLSPNTINALNQVVIWTFDVTNGPTNNSAVSAVITLPVGWAVQPGVVASLGTFAGNTWTIGGMIANQVASIAIPVKNSTIVGSPWVFGAQVFGDDSNITNNQFTESVTLTSCDICPPSAGAVPDPFACICGNVSTNDTRCTSGISSWLPQALSEVNCVINNMDASTGAYNISVYDLTLPWSFQYSLWCDDGSGPLQTSGPALVSGSAILVNLNKIPRLVQEDFNPLVAANTVTLSVAPIIGYQVFVFRNGGLLPLADWSIAGAVITFVNAFGASGGGAYGESVSVQFYKVI